MLRPGPGVFLRLSAQSNETECHEDSERWDEIQNREISGGVWSICVDKMARLWHRFQGAFRRRAIPGVSFRQAHSTPGYRSVNASRSGTCANTWRQAEMAKPQTPGRRPEIPSNKRYLTSGFSSVYNRLKEIFHNIGADNFCGSATHQLRRSLPLGSCRGLTARGRLLRAYARSYSLAGPLGQFWPGRRWLTTPRFRMTSYYPPDSNDAEDILPKFNVTHFFLIVLLPKLAS